MIKHYQRRHMAQKVGALSKNGFEGPSPPPKSKNFLELFSIFSE